MESDYSAPSSPCSSDKSNVTDEFIKLFPSNAFPLLGSKQHSPTTGRPSETKIKKDEDNDLLVGMMVRMVDKPAQVGKVVKREGLRRVQVAFSGSHGRPYKKWLSQHKLEKAPAAPVYAKCPYPPQSLEAKLWYKEHKRVG